MKKTLTIVCLLIAGMTNAQMMAHGWQKQNEWIGQNQYGASVTICTWVCRTMGHNNHSVQTQGHGVGYCPMPN